MSLPGGTNGFHKMIVKMGQNPGFKRYVSTSKRVKAIKMREDFMVETPLGFLSGKKGQYIVDAGKNMRFTCAEKEFLATYSPASDD